MRVLHVVPFLVLGAAAPTFADPAVPGAAEIPGRTLSAFDGRKISSLRLYAFRGESPEAVPFQIDERPEHGRWVLPKGQAKREDDRPGDLDETDALVLMHADLGTRGDLRELPASAERWLEIRVGPADQPLGFAYLGSFRTPPPRSEVDYVSYDPAADRIRTSVYEAVFGAPLPTSLRLDGREENVLRGVHARGEARFLGGLFTLRRDEKDISAELEGWIDGPVRVVRPAKYRIALPLGFRATARVNLLFYRDFVVGHAIAKVKIPPRLVPADGELTAFFEFRDQAGAEVLMQGLDPRQDAAGTEARPLAGREGRWAGLLLRDGRTFLIAVRPEGSLGTLEQRLYFDERKASPAFGFELGRVNRLETGEHDLFVSVMLAGSHDPEHLRRAAEILREPPPVSAAEVVPASATTDLPAR